MSHFGVTAVAASKNVANAKTADLKLGLWIGSKSPLRQRYEKDPNPVPVFAGYANLRTQYNPNWQSENVQQKLGFGALMMPLTKMRLQ